MIITYNKKWRYRAKDESGKWWFYEKQPELDYSEWKIDEALSPQAVPFEYSIPSSSGLLLVFDPQWPDVYWKDSLEVLLNGQWLKVDPESIKHSGNIYIYIYESNRTSTRAVKES